MAARRIALLALIDEMRRIANSPDPLERFRTLWIGVLLNDRLLLCTDREIGDLLVIVKKRFGIFEPEFAICHHAIGRLCSRRGLEPVMRRAEGSTK
jgi:hypothetical protein